MYAMSEAKCKRNEITKAAQRAWQIEKDNDKAIKLYKQVLSLFDETTSAYIVDNIKSRIAQLEK